MYKVFTVESGQVESGAKVESFAFRNGEIVIPAIVVGEEGRGRKLGVLPVAGAKAGAVAMAAAVGETRSGKPKLIATGPVARSDEKAIVVFRTMIGYRGDNAHTGDYSGDGYDSFLDFPGEILSEGVIAQGGAGYAGSGQQLVAVVPKGVVFRTAYGGRLYGSPDEHFYQFDGESIVALTADERDVADLF